MVGSPERARRDQSEAARQYRLAYTWRPQKQEIRVTMPALGISTRSRHHQSASPARPVALEEVGLKKSTWSDQ